MSITATAITTVAILGAGVGGLLLADRLGLLQPWFLDDQPPADRPGSDDQFGEWLGDGDLGRMADDRERAEENLGRKS
ncbi:hypothetical protein [Amycolatopsis sp. NPDC059657]|uniref:hypothetical protein n=1 Tax=Amycolatopsis sp. NPDC059657 TaxID=3346899 RepID=UPI003670C121